MWWWARVGQGARAKLNMNYHEMKMTASYLESTDLTGAQMIMQITSLSAAQNCPVASITLRIKILNIQVPYPSLKGTGSVSWLSHQPRLPGSPFSLQSSHPCLLTVHKPIITGVFSSVFSPLAMDPHQIVLVLHLITHESLPNNSRKPATTLCKESTLYHITLLSVV